MGSIPGLGRYSGDGHSYPLQYSCLGNPKDRGVWLATVHGVAELDTTERLITATAAAAAKSLRLCPTLRNPIDGSPPGSCPWDSPGKNTGVGCHFLLQCMKVKSESEVAQQGPTLSDPTDCSLPGSSIHGIFQARLLEWGAIAFSNQQHIERKKISFCRVL